MTIEAIVHSMLSDGRVAAKVADRVALARLPQNTPYPALVYRVVSVTPTSTVDCLTTPQRAAARVQINPLAIDAVDVTAIHAAVREVMDLRLGEQIAGKHVVSCRLEFVGQMDRDDTAGVWTQPVDYRIAWYE